MLLYNSYPKCLLILETVLLMLKPVLQENKLFQTSYLPGTNKNRETNTLCQISLRYLYLLIQKPNMISLLIFWIEKCAAGCMKKQTIREVGFFEDLEMETAASIYLYKLARICNSW